MLAFSLLLFVYFYLFTFSSSLVMFRGSSKSCTRNRYRNEVFELLQGHYNNRAQAEMDAHKGQDTARKGGHEFVSVLIDPYSNNTNTENDSQLDESNGYSSNRLILIARYFYGTDTSNTFRCRLYEFPEVMDVTLPIKDVVYMKIYKPNYEAEEMLKANAYDLKRYLPSMDNDFEYLSECNLYWKPTNRLRRIAEGKSFRGKLVNDKGVEIPSQKDPTLTLVVYDDLRITKENLFINDRIYNKETGELIIGNTKNVPYKLRRM